MNAYRKKVTYLIVLVLFIQFLPLQALATAQTSTPEILAEEMPVLEDQPINETNIISEVLEKREKNIKHFLKEDKTYEAVIYPNAVHFKNGQVLEDIDNSLIETTDELKQNVLENKKNSMKVRISKNTNPSKLVSVKKDQYEISWGIDSENKSEATVRKDESDFSENLSENEKKRTLKNVQSIVDFPNVYQNTDLSYEIVGEDVKETIILNEKIKNPSYSFTLKMHSLVPELLEDKTIVFYDEKDLKKEVFRMDAPYMFDSKKEESRAIEVSLEKEGNDYKLVITPDSKWINSSERAFPIKIDPTLSTSLERTNIYDNTVSEGYPTTNNINSYINKTGYGSSSKRNRTYISFALPTLSSADMVTNAFLFLNLETGNTSNAQVNVHKVTQNWNTSTINWNNQPSFDQDNVEDFQIINGSLYSQFNWNITGIVKNWYSSGTNYGLMIKNKDENSGYTHFFSSDTSETYKDVRPQVIMQYINNSGLESYWTYHSQSAGRSGIGYVNDYNGNLIFIHNDIDMNGSRMPISINHVFNSNDRNTSNIGFGNGWRLNLNQRIEWQVIDGASYYKYIDEDGTRHYFKYTSATELSDELNLGLTLIKETNGTLSIRDKDSNKMNFNQTTNDLNYIMDASGNKMTFSYGPLSANGVRNLIKVTDGVGRAVSLNYSSSGILSTIQDTAGRITSYQYDGNGNLIAINDADNKTTTFGYDVNRNLINATNFDGYKISYQYYGTAPYRISNILESNIDGTNGNSLNVIYGNNCTTFTDVNGRKNVYQFDNFGITTSIRDADGSAQYYKHGDTTNKTKLTSESKLEKTVINLLPNHDAEALDSWVASRDGGNGTSIISSEAAYIGRQSFKVTKSDNVSRQFYDYWNTLTKGKTYTLSAFVKTVNVTNTNGRGASISFYYKDKTGTFHEISSKSINGTNDWQRLELSFTLPNDAFDTSVVTRLNLLQESGTAYFDSVQLEEGSIANRYNLIENGDLSGMSGIPFRWNGIGINGPDGLVTTRDSDHPVNLDNAVFQVSGVYNQQKKLAQSISVSGKTGDVYTFGTWAKAYSVPSGIFQIQIAFINSNGSQQIETFDFNHASPDWQYLSGECIAKADYSRIDIYYIYGNNANTAYFDGAQLYKEDFGQSYQYDSKGNIVSTQSLAKQNSSFQFNGNNDLVKSVDPKGNAFQYEYDSKRNLTRATSASNIGYSFTYDSYGNAISSRMGDGANYIQTKADYTASGNYLKSLTDSSGNSVFFNYDETRGLLNSFTDANGSTTTNSYDQMDRLTSTSKTVDGQQVSNHYQYVNDQLSQITHNGFNYNFGYDSLGNNTSVSVGNQNLITNQYESRTSLLTKSTYGNGQSVWNSYDYLNRVTGKVVGGDSSVGVTYDAYVQNIGWQPWVNDYNVAGTTGQGLKLEALKLQLTDPVSGMKIKYQTHVQDIGWQNWVYGGNVAGTIGQGLRVEAIRIQLEGAPEGYTVRYQVYVEGHGWMDPVTDGNIAGTTGQNRRLEAIRIVVEKPRYTYQYDVAGNVAVQTDFVNNILYRYTYDTSNRLVKVSESNGNDVSYRYDLNNNISSVMEKVNNQTHTTNYSYDSDNLLLKTTYGSSEYLNQYDQLGRLSTGTIKTGSTQYTTNYHYLPGAVASYIGVSYNGYVENAGWQGAKTDGEISGTVGQALKYQQTNINLTNVPTDLSNPLSKIKIKYQTHVQDIGWQNPVYGGTITGAAGSKIEAIKIQLEGAPEGYHVWYQAHVQGIGWQEPVLDGSIAGTTGKNLRLEALRIYIIKPGSDSKDSTRIGSINNNGKSISYTYDANGNIQTITQGGKQITYHYNELNELIREDNQVLNKTIVMDSDVGGNLKSKTEYPYTTGDLGTATRVVTYDYMNSTWKDMLTSFDGKLITYDAIGNPLAYNGYTYSWEAGDQLSGINGNGLSISYKYNDSGIRTEKTVNGVTTTYHLDGDVVTYETNGTDEIYYTYDSNDKLLSMNLNGEEYYYVRNVQGDIIGLIDKSGTEVVSYQYDTWGQVIFITGTLADTVGKKNPYLYRGYRYDSETGLYYLQSRFYNPEWGRFLNADSYGGTTGELLSHNVFAYCINNPVMLVDSTGFRPIEGAMSAYHPDPITINDGGCRVLPVWEDPIFVGIVGGTALRGAISAVPVVVAGAKNATSVVGNAVKKVFSMGTAKVGAQIGNFGQLIKNPNIKWVSSREHALNKVMKRGITENQIKLWIKNGKVVQQDADTFMYVTKDGVAILNKNGVLQTAYGKDQFREPIKNAIKQLYGK